MIRRIYGQAESTIVWLGEEDQTAHGAFDLIRCFSSVGPSILATDLILTQGDYDSKRYAESSMPLFRQGSMCLLEVIPDGGLSFLCLKDRGSLLSGFSRGSPSDAKQHASVQCGSLYCTVFHLYLARSLLPIDWEVSRPPPGFTMVYNLMHYYVYREL